MKIAISAALLALAISAPAFAAEHTVRMVTEKGAKQPYRFSPAKLSIARGDTVTFVDEQDDSHDVMFESVPKGAEFAKSPMLTKKGQSWSYTFDIEGTYQYHCHPHAALGMRGTIVVGKASKPGDTQKDAHHHHGEHGGMEHEQHGAAHGYAGKHAPRKGKQDHAMEHMGHEDMAHDQAGMAHKHDAMSGFYGSYAMSREASGTAWVPESSPMEGIHGRYGDWMTMVHGYADVIYDHQGGKRGDEMVFSTSMLMLMASRPLGAGTFGLHSMFSIDPLMGKKGYPLILQTGETADGVTHLVDRQHPHDLFMELAASYSHPLDDQSSMFVYAGYPGEPALGPATFMHRTSGIDNPEAPLSHHWLDSTHITFGVATLGYIRQNWKIEASAFRGREPDQYRWNFDPLRLDSWSGRVTYNPNANWSMQVSHGHINSPEQLEPDVDQKRTTASVAYNQPLETGNWQTTFAFGLNNNDPGRSTNAFLLESSLTLQDTHTFFGRGEYVEKDELFEPPSPLAGDVFDVGKLSLGYIYDIPVAKHVKIGIGGLGSVYALPGALDSFYSDDPASAMVFARMKLK
jgi:plastocyanin